MLRVHNVSGLSKKAALKETIGCLWCVCKFTKKNQGEEAKNSCKYFIIYHKVLTFRHLEMNNQYSASIMGSNCHVTSSRSFISCSVVGRITWMKMSLLMTAAKLGGTRFAPGDSTTHAWLATYILVHGEWRSGMFIPVVLLYAMLYDLFQ